MSNIFRNFLIFTTAPLKILRKKIKTIIFLVHIWNIRFQILISGILNHSRKEMKAEECLS